MRDLLDGTTCVRLSDAEGGRVHFESPVAFRGNAAALAFQDAHGHPLAVDKAGHLTRVFSETDDDVRRHIAEGTARAIADLRDRVGIDAHLSYGCLLGAVRDGHMIGHDSDADLAYLSRWTHPADVVRESFRMERELRALGWKVVRMSGADLEALPPAARRPGGARRRLRRLPRRGHLLPARRSQRTARPRGADTRVHGDPRGRRARGSRRPGGGAGVPLRRRLADPRPGLQPGRPVGRDPAHRGLDAWRPHPRGRLERALPQPARRDPAQAVLLRRSGPTPGWTGPVSSPISAPARAATRAGSTPAGTGSSASTSRARRCARPGDDSPSAGTRTPRCAHCRSTTSAPPCSPVRSCRASPSRRTSTPAAWSAASTSRPARTCGGCRRCRCAAAAPCSWSTPPRDPGCADRHPADSSDG